jgi:predicted kinase
MSEPLIHFVCGSTGAGKTTYALSFASRIGAARFSIDEWMSCLFWPDAPQPIDPGWAMERVGRCRDLIWSTAVDAADRGMTCVLEIGLTTVAARAAMAAKASEAGLVCRFHLLDVAVDER